MSEFHQHLRAAQARIEAGNAARGHGADEKARVIAGEVARRGAGGAAAVAAELGVSKKTISEAVRRAERATAAVGGLPPDTLPRLLAAELAEVAPLPARQWEVLVAITRGLFLDVVWIESPGELLAQEVEDTDEVLPGERDELAARCRSWPRAQALAVLDACQRAPHILPVAETETRS